MASRSDFSAKTKAALGKRAGYSCALCTGGTVGPSQKSPYAVTNVGVAAHIAAARPRGPRYDPLMSSEARAHIGNGIWLCQVHAKLVDDDPVTWTVEKLRAAKQAREAAAYRELGIKRERGPAHARTGLEVKEYAFAVVGKFVPAYRTFIAPILEDKGLTEKSEVGILMCGRLDGDGVACTLFVQADWLRWLLAGKSANFAIQGDVPAEHIHGKLPGWPDDFFEFLDAIVETNTTFGWQRHPDGFLALAQMP